jgi:hypothetical protein
MPYFILFSEKYQAQTKKKKRKSTLRWVKQETNYYNENMRFNIKYQH